VLRAIRDHRFAVPFLLVFLGLGLRTYHYARNPSMWHDEAALVLNVLDKDYGKLLGPLYFSEAAPPLFLWIEKAVVSVLGDSTYALRLVPFLASCAALILFASSAGRILQPGAFRWALVLFACSDHLLWHACEAKPYSLDVLCATLLIWLFVFTRGRSIEGRLFAYGLAAPAFVWLVYPGCFLAGGLLLALLPAVWRGSSAAKIHYLALAASILGAFALLAAGPAHAQRNDTILSCWESTFPPTGRPWMLPVWFTLSTFEIFRYSCEPAGQAFLPIAVVGFVSFLRRRMKDFLVLLLAPVGLTLIAAFLRAYPYGGTRLLAFAIPAVVLLTAQGVAPLCRRLSSILNPRSSVRFLLPSALGLLLLTPMAWSIKRIVHPWLRADCAGAADYVLAHRRPGDLVASNHWEYAYYFRELGAQFELAESASFPAFYRHGTRVWVVATANTEPDRAAVLRALTPPHWEAQARYEFHWTSVALLSKKK
jgi:hypothetical protein